MTWCMTTRIYYLKTLNDIAVFKCLECFFCLVWGKISFYSPYIHVIQIT